MADGVSALTMASQPLVSIVMPAYNAGATIDEAVQSVLQQTYQNWELIIVNDGSEDGTRDYLDGLHHPRIRVVHQQNRGVSAARNVGLDALGGEFVTFLDADDSFPPKSLEYRVRMLLEDAEADVIGGSVTTHDRSMTREESRTAPKYRGPFLDRLLCWDQQVFSSICYMVRREKLFEVRFDEGMSNLEDLQFWIRASHRHSLTYAATDHVVYRYRNSPNSLSGNLSGWRCGLTRLADEVRTLQAVSWSLRMRFRARACVMLMKDAVRRYDLGSAHAAIKTMPIG